MAQIEVPRESLKFTEARPKLSELLNRVYKREARIVIKKGDIPVAALVSISDLEWLENDDKKRARLAEALSEFGAAFADQTPEQIEAAVDAAVAEVRAEARLAENARR